MLKYIYSKNGTGADMRRKEKLPELLAPAGDFECLVAAVSAGADAVYVGGLRFGARAFAKNFDIDGLRLAVEYCHLYSVKLYVTVNTLLFDKEIDEALSYCAELYRIGVDAVICQDVGLISLLKECVPSLEVHASTQLSVHNTLGADMAEELGCRRVVLARELSARDIKATTDTCRPETEVFLHGALCVCHSGQCLFSSLIGGRSGNRGECAQPCRLPYEGGYRLSLSDLALCGHIPELIESGVASLKIEGRMKSPAYVYTVTSIYRRLLDERRAATPNEEKRLRLAFSRDGFTDGYFVGRLSGMEGVRTDKDKAQSRSLSEDMKFEQKKLPVRAVAKIKLGRASQMTIYTDARSYTAYGDIPSEAISSPLDPLSVRSRLAKTGATPLSLCESDIELELDGGVNLPISAINALRREACRGFLSSERELSEIQIPVCKKYPKPLAGNTALFLNPAIISELDARILSNFDKLFVPLFSPEAESGRWGVYIPPVIFDSELAEVKERLLALRAAGVEYALVSNISHIPLCRELGLSAVGDIRLNITNKYAKSAYAALGVPDSLLSAELTLPRARDIGGRVTVYGRIPLMLTERCYMRHGDCRGICPSAPLVDRRGAKFPIMREYRHRNLILNSATTYMADKEDELCRAGIFSRHFIFSTESADEASRVASAYFSDGGYQPKSIRRIGVK